MFNLDTLEYTVGGICLAACIRNEVKNYREVKFMENQPKPNWEEIHKLEEYYDRRRKAIVLASLINTTLSVARTLKNRKK